MRNNKFFISSIFLLISFCFSFAAKASLVIEITQGSSNPIPIAIVPMAMGKDVAMSEDISQIVMDDLKRSGVFSPIPRENMLSMPSSAEEIKIQDWRILQVDYVVAGRINFLPGQNQYQVSYELVDTIKQETLLRETLTVPGSHARNLAHKMSDQIYEKLTGIKGVFSTRFIYVTVKKLGNKQREYQLFVADIDGERNQMLLKSNEPILSPSWSPDGKKIAYVSFESKRPAIYIQDVTTGSRQQITNFPGLNGSPSWSPDGRSLAMVLSKDGNPEIYVMNIATKSLERLTNHYAIDTEPSWSPDGNSLIFTSDRGGKPQIYRLELGSNAVKRLTFNGEYNAKGQLSSDGKFLGMVHQQNKLFHIAVQDMQRGTVKVLTQSSLDESPSIAPNSNMLIYATSTNRGGVLSVVSFDGKTRYVLPFSEGDVREPAWSPFFNY